MSGPIRIEFTNLKQYEAELLKLADAAGPKAVYAALTLGGGIIRDEWKLIAPYLTGTFMRSIQVQYTPLGQSGGAAMIGTDISEPPYPVWLEYGTLTMPARPTGRQAWDTKIAEAKKEIADVLKLRIEEAVT